jgi:sugar phosphate isomerase/epimerase
MRIALCNEVLQPMTFAEQCAYAAALGYDGLEVAPYTLSDEPHRMSAAERAAVRRAASDAGIGIMGLHYLLVAPKGLSITTPDDRVRAFTTDVMRALVDLCADLGGRYMVHGSQRVVAPGETAEIATRRAADCIAAVAGRAEAGGIAYCIEPLAAHITPVINTIAQAAAIADAIGSPSIMTMIDCNHAGRMEPEALPQVVDRWVPTGKIGHIQINDSNRRGPGQGEARFTPFFAALKRNGYRGDISVEPMEYIPDGRGSAARAIGYVHGILEALDR